MFALNKPCQWSGPPGIKKSKLANRAAVLAQRIVRGIDSGEYHSFAGNLLAIRGREREMGNVSQRGIIANAVLIQMQTAIEIVSLSPAQREFSGNP
jgi:hypothetical protein